MFKKSIYVVVCLVMLMFIALFFLSLHQSKNIRREPQELMSKYYRLKITNPAAAQQALLILLSQKKPYLPAINEARLLYSQNQDFEKALRMSKRLDDSVPNHKTLIQLAYLDAKKCGHSLGVLLPSRPVSAHKEIPKICPFPAPKPAPLVRIKLNPVDTMANRGFLAIKHNQPYVAIDYFTRAYELTHQPNLAMQLGYLYDQVDNKPAAYKAFKLASRSPEPELALRAENAMTNLAGLQTKALPYPYFSEVFFNPFTQSRFGLTVRPLYIRAGIEQKNSIDTKQYVFLRRTDDNKSENLGQISQIYEDNVQIEGIGAQVTPLKRIPLVGFLEAGVAYDLVYRDRDRWRGDLRGGVMYYDEFCARPAYFEKLTWSSNYYSDVYGDATYFTRYTNLIAGVKTHQGIRLLQYHSSMVNLYAVGRVIGDTQRLFFNNFAEIGPGIEFIPTNRLNIRFRFEHVDGMYLPAGAIPNPYRLHYVNNMAQLLFYVKI